MTTEDRRPAAASEQLISVRQLPNLVTILRIALVAPAAWMLWQDQVGYALALIAVAGLSDAVDGELARRFNWRTRFGAIADPTADKLLVVVIFAVLAIQGHLPIWLLTVVVARDVVIVSGALTYRRLFGHLDIEPTLLSKVNTGSQVVMLILLLIARTDVEPLATMCAAAVAPTGFVVVAAFSVISGTQYVIVWSRRAKLAARRRQARALSGGARGAGPSQEESLSGGARGAGPSQEESLSGGARGAGPSQEESLSGGARGDDPSQEESLSRGAPGDGPSPEKPGQHPADPP